MTTLSSPTSRPVQFRSPVVEPARVPFGRLLAVETRKLVDTRSGVGLLTTIGLITAAVIVLVLLTAEPAGLTFSDLGLAAAFPQSLLLPVLGVLAATSEWSQRTGLLTFTLEPRRLRVGAAKLVASLGVAMVAIGVALAVGALANLAGILWLDGVGTWHISAQLLLGGILFQLISVAQGIALGAAIGNSAAAIVALFGLPTAMLAITSLWDSAAWAGRWLDLSSSAGPLLAGTMSLADWAPLGTSVGVWVVLPLVVGGYRLVRREIV